MSMRHLLLCAGLVLALAKTSSAGAETTAQLMPETMAMLRHAIAMQTVKGEGQVPAFARYLAGRLESTGFASAHNRISNLAVLTGGPAHAEGLPITPQWPKIAALMDRNIGPVLRGARPASSLSNGLSQAIDQVLRAA